MEKKKRIAALIVFLLVIALLIAGIALCPSVGEKESIKEVMRDAVLHETGKIDLFGWIKVNPALISAFVLTGVFLLFGLIVRFFAVPRFRRIPGRFQMILEQAVGFFDGLARRNSPRVYQFLGAYIFTAGAYIFIGTLFELFGFQAVTAAGRSISLPAPLADINGAIAMGVMSYGVILIGGLIHNGLRGVLSALKDFSLPISMSFRLFGALLSGTLVTELVYYYSATSYVLPALVGVLFTLIHALIQTYVLTMLTAVFYGEATARHAKKTKAAKNA